MDYVHTDNLKTLVEHGIITENEGYNYILDPLHEMFEAYFQSCQEDLSVKSDQYEFLWPLFYFSSRNDFNAGAEKKDILSTIHVNKGLVKDLHHLFNDNSKIYENDLLKKFQDTFDKSAASLMFQSGIDFTFFHEKGHLVQYHSFKSGNILLGNFEGPRPEDAVFSLPSNVGEYDADLFACSSISSKILNEYNHLSEAMKTKENFILFVSVAITGIFSYFILISRIYQVMYYEKSTHPHPVVRVYYVLSKLQRLLKLNVGRDRDQLCKNVDLIVTKLFEEKEQHLLNNFRNNFNESTLIVEYIKGTLLKGIGQFLYLTINSKNGKENNNQ